MSVIYSSELEPSSDVDKILNNNMQDSSLPFGPGLTSSKVSNVEKPRFSHKLSTKYNNSFNTIPSQTGPYVDVIQPFQSVEKVFPRQNLVARKGKNETTQTITRRKLRKKRKFRLIPTFKHLENGRFVGRSKEMKLIRTLLSGTAAKTKTECCFKNQNPQNMYSRLSFLSISGHTGVGKSSLAYVYLMAYEKKYKYVFWINSNSILSDVRDILLYHLGNKYEVQAIKSERSAEILRLRFLHYLSNLKSDWLLVLDEFNDSSVKIQQWVPKKLEALEVNSLHKIKQGHVLLTTNMIPAKIKRAFCKFKSEIKNIELNDLTQVQALKLVSKNNEFVKYEKASKQDEDAILRLLNETYLNCEVLPLSLLTKLVHYSSFSWKTIFLKYKQAFKVLRADRVSKLKLAFKKLKEKENKQNPKRQLFSRDSLLLLISNSKKHQKNVSLIDLDGFNSDLFEIELILRKFNLLKYFSSIVESEIKNLYDISRCIIQDKSTHFWTTLTYLSKRKRKNVVTMFDPRDEEKFIELVRYVKHQLSQVRVEICIKLWIEVLTMSSSPTAHKFNVKALEILQQASWFSYHRIPLFIFPELLLEQPEDHDFNSGSTSNSSYVSFSTGTNNSAALSSLNLNSYVDTKINGSCRFNSSELSYFDCCEGLLNFFIQHCLLKMEKTGFISCNSLIQTAFMNLEAKTEQSFLSVLSVIRKVHVIGFEFNFSEVVGESLSLLRNYNELVSNAYNKVDIKFVESLNDRELQDYCSHDFSLKLNMLPHFEYIRMICFKEVFSNKSSLKQYLKLCKATRTDLFGIRHAQIRNFNNYLKLVVNSESEALFNASRAPFFPEFQNRDLLFVKADLLFNEGLLILSIPFRGSKIQDAFRCFKGAYILFEKAFSLNHTKPRDCIYAKCSFQMAKCLYENQQWKESLLLFELALSLLKDFHGEYGNHPDIARTLSSIACVYHELADRCVTKRSNNSGAKVQLSVIDLFSVQGNFQRISKIDLSNFVQTSDAHFLTEEALKYHQLSLQMYMDILGHRPLHPGFARSLTNRAKTFLLLSDLDEAINDFKDALDIYQQLSERAMILKEKVGVTATCLAQACCQKDDGFQRFIYYLNIAMKTFSELSTYEMNLFKDRHARRKSIGVPMCTADLTDTDMTKLNPHPLLCETLVKAADILVRNNIEKEKIKVLYRVALQKYKELFGTFEHPRILAILKKTRKYGI